MTKKTALTGLIALAFVAAGCSKQEAPPSAVQDDEEEVTSAAPAPVTQPELPKDYNLRATGMAALLSERPECQRFRDELATIAQTPEGQKPARDPALVVAEAHEQGCSKKAEQSAQ